MVNKATAVRSGDNNLGPIDLQNRIYSGIIQHRRFLPVEHKFRYRISMVFLDLDSLPNTLKIPMLLHASIPSLGWFRRTDYHGEKHTSLKSHISENIFEKTGKKFSGRIFLLTHLRYWGLLMNPISVFYCFDESSRLRHVVLQVTNTPWKEKVLYVLNPEDSSDNHEFSFEKEMHVSPFNPMNMHYYCKLNRPGSKLVLHLENHCDGDIHTDATLSLEHEICNEKALLKLVFVFPSQTLKTLSGIYWNAFRLWLKKAPFYGHPAKFDQSTQQNTTAIQKS